MKLGPTMKIRRTHNERDLRQLPLDATDMFLLTRVVGTVALAELLAVAPCDSLETTRRVEQLVKLGVLKVEGRQQELAADGIDGIRTVASHDEDAVTLRPPKAGADPLHGARATPRIFGRPRPT